MRNSIGIISMQHVRPFTADSLGQLERWKAAGYDFVEFLVPEPGEIDLVLLKRAMADAGLATLLTARLSLSRDIVSNDATARSSGSDYLRYCLDVAGALDAQTITGPLYGSPLVFAGRAPHPISETERQARVERCVAALADIGAEAERAGRRLAVEPLNRFETDFINTTAQGVELVRLVGSPAVGLSLDTFHMNMEEGDIPEAVAVAGRHIFHFQANENHRGYLGSGHIDWTAVARALRRAGYDGPVTLEPFRRTDERISVPFAQWKPPRDDEQEALAASRRFMSDILHLAGRNG
jgi:D-psicose/D-tagatose/L-ribulose 3-epimerase